MNNTLYQAMNKRKSFHVFRNVGNEALTQGELASIEQAWASFTPLYPNITTAITIVPEEETNCKAKGEYCIMVYSETKENYLQNIGYLGEQLDLYLVSKNIGSVWYGLGKTENQTYNGLHYVIMFSIRKVTDIAQFRANMEQAKRKKLEEIWEGEHLAGVSEIVRFAPSACNFQPWKVERREHTLHVYRRFKLKNIPFVPKEKLAYFNRIDMGIFLCYIDICLEHENIAYEKELFTDNGAYEDMVPNAKYQLQ